MKVRIADIQQAVCDHYGVAFADLVGPSRRREIAWPRQMAMYLCRRYTARSSIQIGQWFGSRDHSTVLKGCDLLVNRACNKDRADFFALRRKIVTISGRVNCQMKERVVNALVISPTFEVYTG